MKTRESHLLVLKALKEGDSNITALNQGKYKTTRVSNIIIDLRRWGVDITSEWITPPSQKRFVRYTLLQSQENLEKVDSLISRLELIHRLQESKSNKAPKA